MKVVFRKHIHSGFSSASGDDEWVDMVLDVPFVPNKDMVVRVKSKKDGDGDIDDIYLQITEITWVHEKNVLVAYVEPNEELYEKGRTSVEGLSYEDSKRLAEIVKEHLECGWVEASTDY